GVNREIKAIHEEFSKGFNSEEVKKYHVIKALANPKHPLHRFSTGNKESLQNVSQETLKEWFAKNYSASIMHLYVLSPLPIETLKSLVVNDFSMIPNRHVAPTPILQPALEQALLGNLIYVESKKSGQTLTALFEMPKQTYHDLDAKAEDLISY